MNPSATPSPPAATSSLGGVRLFLILFALLLLAASTWRAWDQMPRAHPLNRPEFPSKAWWAEPVERNAVQRLPALPGDPEGLGFLPDNQHGWLYGSGVVYVTADGGRTWLRRSPPRSIEIRAVAFTDARHGWAVTEQHIYVTSNGGVEWASQYRYPGNPSSSLHPTRLRMTSASSGWATMYGELLSMENGVWQAVRPDGVAATRWQDVQFSGRRGWAVGVVAGDGGSVLAQTSDGGLSWRTQPLAKQQRLSAVYFRSELEGWAAGEQSMPAQQLGAGVAVKEPAGLLLHTTDGGASWQPAPLPARVARLTDIVFQQQHGWIRQPWGDTLHTADGGRSWQLDPVACGRLCHFSSTSRGWRVRRLGDVWATDDAGANWFPLTAPVNTWTVGSLAFVNERQGWISGASGDNRGLAGGYVMATADGGRNWRQQRLPQGVDYVGNLQFLGALRGSAVYAAGGKWGVMLTDDGGANWRLREMSGLTVHDVQFADAAHGWVTGAGGQGDGVLLRTSDRGLSWAPLALPAGVASVSGLQFQSAQKGWLLGAPRGALTQTLYGTDDGGSNWRPVAGGDAPIYQFQATPGRLWMQAGGAALKVSDNDGVGWRTLALPAGSTGVIAFHAFDARHAWLVDYRNKGYRTDDGGSQWSSFQVEARGPQQRGNSFVTPLRGWAIADGRLRSTLDGGLSWQAVGLSAQLPADYLTWFMQPDGRGYLIDKEQQRYLTNDGGLTWTEAGDYRRYFPPWWWAVTLMALLLCASALAIDPGTLKGASSIEDKLAPDAPITRAEQDQLGYFRIAEGLAGFITNPATVPPFSISITGPWGKGKSSIMGLLRRRLEQWRFPIVWFNAWHHQKSEQILASLFAHIRDQAIPPLLSRRGITFRMRLAGSRWRESGLLIPLLLLAVFVLAWYATDAASLARLVEQWIAHGDASVRQTLAGAPAAGSKSDRAGWLFTALLTSGAAIGSAALVLKGVWTPLGGVFKTFGVDAKSLMSSIKRLQPGSMESSPAARYRFAKDFGEVCDAYGIRQLVVFVDDIDRCDPAVVPEVLELINFLMSSGKCFVVLGAEKTWVQAAIANAYKDIFSTISAQSGGTADAAAHKEFAHSYLEKLLNLEVPVTASGDNLVKAMLAPPAVPEPPAKRLSLAALRRFRVYWPWMLGVALLIATVLGGSMAGRLAREADEASVTQPSAPSLAALMAAQPTLLQARIKELARPCAVGDLGCDELPPRGVAGAELPDQSPGTGGASSAPVVATALVLVVMLALAVLSWMRVPRFVRSDSANFQKALEIWSDWLSERHKSPRSFKRFVNKVRFLAMLERGASAQPVSWWRRAWLRWRSGAAPAAAQHDSLSPAIVAYAAILSRQQGWRCGLLSPLPAGGEAELKTAFDASGGTSFEQVRDELKATLEKHLAEPGFRLPAGAPDWLPESSLCKLIEQVVLA